MTPEPDKAVERLERWRHWLEMNKDDETLTEIFEAAIQLAAANQRLAELEAERDAADADAERWENIAIAARLERETLEAELAAQSRALEEARAAHAHCPMNDHDRAKIIENLQRGTTDKPEGKDARAAQASGEGG